MYAALPCDYKRRRRASFRRDATLQRLQTRSIITYAPASLFATFNPSSSRDLGAFLPLSPRLYPLLQAPTVEDSTVLSHTPLLDVRSRGRNQDKPVCYCVASCINHLGRGTHNINTSWVKTPIVSAPGRGRCVTFLFCSHLISRDGEQIQPISHGSLESAPSGIRDLIRES